MEGSANERLDFGKMGYGCKHYRRRCKIRAPCCNEIFECRHCHNEGMLKNPYDRHEINRLEVTQVICSVCDTEQPVARVCTNCGVNMAEYFCEICKFYDDDLIILSTKRKKKEYLGKDYSFSVVHLSNLFSWIKIWHLTHDPSMLFEHFFSSTDLGLNMLQTEKQQFHCDDCGICRTAE